MILLFKWRNYILKIAGQSILYQNIILEMKRKTFYRIKIFSTLLVRIVGPLFFGDYLNSLHFNYIRVTNLTPEKKTLKNVDYFKSYLKLKKKSKFELFFEYLLIKWTN